ncbi:MAG TPA: hypothetical protein VED16_03465 [Candidatus Acidoferrum sp.]|nr:hypothetical protein [Candidatus Acidoferrum sp.]
MHKFAVEELLSYRAQAKNIPTKQLLSRPILSEGRPHVKIYILIKMEI